ncbi:dienelactone hydrolase family protein [Bradyrhizobium manausense]|uniref:dienelactone hydrolase family protein n=1 Tax=Bradyrhizobium TaxID=374 RepID=UPI001BABD0F5|nr:MULTISPECIES: dienelactone hydrolase family protein [Bradyrhizobium]MBR0828092.1 dienelactone hydrolase family protein [Bradyrhizobium manausense]UVO32949.1 dienelactone hydrolase family protein [Bradyrhizobium arachidis]
MPTRLILCAALAWTSLATGAAAEPQTVYFPSGDGTTQIVGYVFKPKTAGPYPAIVMLHGRGGPYSSNTNGGCTLVAPKITSACNASTLSKRNVMWGQYWADRGYLALLPDSFGPRGKAHGFGRFTHGDPDRDDVNEKTVRPLDAEGALAYLRSRSDVSGGQVFLHGWSNGGSTALNVMIRQGAGTGFRGALAFYPGCGVKALLQQTVVTTTPIAIFHGTSDEEVSAVKCQDVAERSRAAGTPIDITLYPGATHGFDEPSSRRQSVGANQAALGDVLTKARAAVERWKK